MIYDIGELLGSQSCPKVLKLKFIKRLLNYIISDIASNLPGSASPKPDHRREGC